MSSQHWSLVEAAALLLEPAEREVILGDLAETGERAWRGVMGVLGLIARRQATEWRQWRPWLAAFGLALPGSFFLMGASVSVSAQVASFIQCLTFTPRGGLSLACQIALLLAWSWTGGFVVGSISRRTLWVSAVLCASPCLVCLSQYHHQRLSWPCLIVFLAPAIVGVVMGLKMMRISFFSAVTLAVIVTSMVPTLLSDPAAMLGWAVIWPAWYLVWTARRGPQASQQSA
jgi:hypothetical protein